MKFVWNWQIATAIIIAVLLALLHWKRKRLVSQPPTPAKAGRKKLSNQVSSIWENVKKMAEKFWKKYDISEYLRAFGIIGYMFVFYADIFLACFHISDYLLSLFARVIIYAFSLFDLPPGRYEFQILVCVFAALFGTVYAIEKTYRNFLIAVPEYAGALTMNYFDGRWHKYGQGLHLKWPAEIVKPSLIFSLQKVTVSFEESFNTRDGAVAIVKGSLIYRPSFKRLKKYASIDEKSLVTSLLNNAKSDLTVELSTRTSQQAREQTNDIKRTIEGKYKGKQEAIEKTLGVDIKDFTVADIGFDDATQTAMSAAYAGEVMFRNAKGDPNMQNNLLILAGKNVEKRIIDIPGLDKAGPAIGAYFAAGPHVANLFAKKDKPHDQQKQNPGPKKGNSEPKKDHP